VSSCIKIKSFNVIYNFYNTIVTSNIESLNESAIFIKISRSRMIHLVVETYLFRDTIQKMVQTANICPCSDYRIKIWWFCNSMIWTELLQLGSILVSNSVCPRFPEIIFATKSSTNCNLFSNGFQQVSAFAA
jgi:hypothetical protein